MRQISPLTRRQTGKNKYGTAKNRKKNDRKIIAFSCEMIIIP